MIDCFRGKALDLFSGLQLEVRENFDLLTKKLDHRFGRKDPPASVRQQLASLKQKAGQTLEEYAERAQKLALDSFPEAEGDASHILLTVAMEAFLKGCTHWKAALQVLNKEPATLEDALHLMKIHEQNWGIMFGSVKKSVKAVSFEDNDSDDDFFIRCLT